ncbi:hypothetical protein BAE44_0024040, partial [Dichanthelium oligosanthes]
LVTKARRKAFDSLCLLLARHLWLERNSRVFRNASRLPGSLVNVIFEQSYLWGRAGLLDRSCLLGDQRLAFLVMSGGFRPSCTHSTPRLIQNVHHTILKKTTTQRQPFGAGVPAASTGHRGFPTARLRRHPRRLRSTAVSPASTAVRRATPELL